MRANKQTKRQRCPDRFGMKFGMRRYVSSSLLLGANPFKMRDQDVPKIVQP